MKNVDSSKVGKKSRTYIGAVMEFFNGISEVAYIEDLYFIRATKNRVYFHVGNIALNRYCYDYECDVFVSKKSLKVEMCRAIPNGIVQVITSSMLENFRRVCLGEDED